MLCLGIWPAAVSRYKNYLPGKSRAGSSLQYRGKNLLVIHRGHVADQVHHLVGVAALVVVPGDDLHEGFGQSDTGLGIEDGGTGIAQEVGGDNVLVGVTQNALQLALRRCV